MTRDRRLLVLGVGNPHRGDDGVGPYAARCLTDRWRRRAWPGVRILSIDGEATNLLDRLAQADHAFIIDACRSNAAPGALFRFDASAGPLPVTRFALSSHGPGLSEALELARVLDLMPERCIVYAVEGEHFAPGAPLSRRAQCGALRAAFHICREIEDGGLPVKV